MNEYKIMDIPDLPLLEEKDTRKLISKAHQGDEKARDKLVKHNLKLVLKIAHRFQNKQYSLQDLFQIGVIGLIKAINGFDLQRNVRFSTYAFSRITGEIRLHLRDDGPIKVSRKIKKIGRILRKKREELKQLKNREPTISELIEDTGYSREEIVQAFEAGRNPASIYKPFCEKEGEQLLLIDHLEINQQQQEISETDKLNLMEVINELDERDRKLIYYRYFEDKTQQETGEEIGVSQVQVSRLEKKILARLKKKLS